MEEWNSKRTEEQLDTRVDCRLLGNTILSSFDSTYLAGLSPLHFRRALLQKDAARHCNSHDMLYHGNRVMTIEMGEQSSRNGKNRPA